MNYLQTREMDGKSVRGLHSGGTVGLFALVCGSKARFLNENINEMGAQR